MLQSSAVSDDFLVRCSTCKRSWAISRWIASSCCWMSSLDERQREEVLELWENSRDWGSFSSFVLMLSRFFMTDWTSLEYLGGDSWEEVSPRASKKLAVDALEFILRCIWRWVRVTGVKVRSHSTAKFSEIMLCISSSPRSWQMQLPILQIARRWW